jgi:sulfur carrier protein
MEIQIRLFAGLREYARHGDMVELEEGRDVLDLIEKLGIPPQKVAIILVNGRHAREGQHLHDGETVSLFPAIAGG